jgi:L-threonylcarbamoyladenylate synthase
MLYPLSFLETIKCLKNDSAVIVPTDTVWGLAARASSTCAVNHLTQLKKRPLGKPFPIHVASLQNALKLVSLSPKLIKLATHFWPGALTLLAPLKGSHSLVSGTYHENGLCGIRVPQHEDLLKILYDLGEPLAVPSANPHGISPPQSHIDLESIWKDESIMFFESMNSILQVHCKLPSTIVQEKEGQLMIVRLGAISEEQMKTVLF